jgi:hypothetical protein
MALHKHQTLEHLVRSRSTNLAEVRASVSDSALLEVPIAEDPIRFAGSCMALAQRHPKVREFVYIAVAETLFVFTREEAEALAHYLETGKVQP